MKSFPTSKNFRTLNSIFTYRKTFKKKLCYDYTKKLVKPCQSERENIKRSSFINQCDVILKIHMCVGVCLRGQKH